MSFDSYEEIIKFAIEKEKEAAAFYEDASRQEPYSGAKETFESFAKEEKKHQAMLEDFLRGERNISEYKFTWIPDMKRSDYMVDLEYEKGMPYSDILRLAMKREEKSLKLYNELAEKTDKGSLAEVFKMLCQEEAKHKLKLETLYDDHMAELGD
jgi:rubrerythrin